MSRAGSWGHTALHAGSPSFTLSAAKGEFSSPRAQPSEVAELGLEPRELPSTPKPLPPTVRCDLPCQGSLLGVLWLLACSLGAAPGRGWGGEAQRGTNPCGSRSPWGQQDSGLWGSASPSHPCGHEVTTALGLEWGKGKPQHPAFYPRPQLLCICLFTLEKAPRPRQEMGQFQEARQGWGTRSHIVLHVGAPQPGLLQSSERGICTGAQAGRRRGGRGTANAPSQPSMKGLLCMGSGSG